MWIRKIVEKIKFHLSHEWCYTRMEADGVAVMGCCCGVVGGDRTSDYLSYMCMDCPHWIPCDTKV